MKRFLTLCLRGLIFFSVLLLYLIVAGLWTVGIILSVYYSYRTGIRGVALWGLLAAVFFLGVLLSLLLVQFIAVMVYSYFPFFAEFCYPYSSEIGTRPIYQLLLSKKNLGTSALGILCIEAVIALFIICY